jgi:hypothetical protein
VHFLDWTMVCGYFVLMVAIIGWWSHNVSDFFTAGGKTHW